MNVFLKKTYYKSKINLMMRRVTTGSVNYGKFRIQSLKDFDAHVKNNKVPVIVDFFATWCNPCKAMTPRLESIIAENEGKVDLAIVDVDENTDLALDYQVGTVPVLLAIKNGKVEHRLVGLQDTESIRKFVGNILHEPNDDTGEAKETILEASKPLPSALHEAATKETLSE